MLTQRNVLLIGDETVQHPYADYVRNSREALVAKYFGIRESESYLPQSRLELRPPALDPLHGMQNTVNPVDIQVPNSNGSVDRFNHCIVSRSPGTRGVDLDPILMSRQAQRLAGELAAVTAEQLVRNSKFLIQPV